MALSLSKLKEGVAGDLRYWFGEVTFDSSYPTGGESFAAADLKFTSITFLSLNTQTDEAGVHAAWDRANNKIKLFDEDNTSGVAAEFANTGDASGVVLHVAVFGY